MFSRTISIGALFAAVLAAGSLPAPAQGLTDEVVWIESYEQAVAEAKRTGKPIFLTFRCVP